MPARFKPLIVVAIAAIAALALAACSSGPSSAASSASGSSSSGASSEPSSDETVLDASDTVFISLDYNAGTGYEWACTADPEGVLVQTDKVTEDRAEPGVVGGPLRDTFTFRAQQPGEVVLTFNLVRPWEAGTAPAETQVYAFTVTKSHEVKLNREKSDFVLDPEWITYS